MTWVERELGARLVDTGDGEDLAALVALALRRNPRRAHLLVSSVLGKHVPVAPATVLSAGERLGREVAAALGTDRVAYVLGYAETATALGHCVASTLGAPYVHSTRRLVADVDSAVAFDEEHSHATRHRLLPDDTDLLAREGVVVLVDDEVSTGRTALNTIASLQRVHRRERYLLASLVDMRDDDLDARELGTAEVGVVSLGRGRVELPAGFAADAARAAAGVADTVPRWEPAPVTAGRAVHTLRPWPADVREGGRHGFTPQDDDAARFGAACAAAALAPAVEGARVLVLGCEELMYAPLLVADALQNELGDQRKVLFSSTTRSPVVAIDEPGYPIRTRLAFAAHDRTVGTDSRDSAPRFAYNVAPGAAAAPFDDIVLVVDDVADTSALRTGLLAQLSAIAGRTHLVVVPSHQPVGARAVSA